MKIRLFACLGLAMCLAGCASPSAPLPPSLRLPTPVEDLTATRKGDRVLLTWTPATQTTDGENIRKAGPTLVCRAINGMEVDSCANPVATLKDLQVEHWTESSMVSRQEYVDTLSREIMNEHPLGFATYALEDRNTSGKAAGMSNDFSVPLAPTLDAPSGLMGKVTPDGVLLTWVQPASTPVQNPGLSYFFRILRAIPSEPSKPQMIVGETPVGVGPGSFLDRNIEWEKAYVYRVEPVTSVRPPDAEPVEVEGDSSPALYVTARDVFPPVTPGGLQAVFSGVGQKPFIDLTWAPNLEPDLAGYNVYRHEAGTEPVKINQGLVKTPSFRDAAVEPGHEYWYAVSAVDARGNESARSEAASEKVPVP